MANSNPPKHQCDACSGYVVSNCATLAVEWAMMARREIFLKDASSAREYARIAAHIGRNVMFDAAKETLDALDAVILVDLVEDEGRNRVVYFIGQRDERAAGLRGWSLTPTFSHEREAMWWLLTNREDALREGLGDDWRAVIGERT